MTEYIPYTNILALYPNTRGFGYAFFKDEFQLKQFGMSVSKTNDNAHYLKRIMYQVNHFQPLVILLATQDGKHNRKRPRIQQLLEAIQAYALEQNIPVVTYSREQIRATFEKFDATTKQEIAEKICVWFPQLEKYNRIVHRKWYMPEDYYQGMFDALSLAVVHADMM
ncbi:MAG: hypothetical protein K1X55_17040 [Chitinophagales bacterium]|nr:hypothetical protein [Chitinophagales bacterium]